MKALFFSRALSSGVSLLTVLFLAKSLGVEKWGAVSLAVSIFTFIALFIDAGFFSSGARLIVGKASQKKDAEGTIGILYIIFLIVSIVCVFLIYLISAVSTRLFGVEVSMLLLLTAPVSWTFIAPPFAEQILKAQGLTGALGMLTLLSKVLPAALIAACFYLNCLNPVAVIYCFALANLTIIFLMLFIMPSNGHIRKKALLEVLGERKRFGGKIYLSRLANIASYNSDKLLLGAFVSVESVGLYSLSMSLCSGLTLFAGSASTAKFREFGLELIDQDYFNKVKKILISGAILTLIIIFIIVKEYLGESYAEVIELSFFCVIALFFQSLYQPYNSWLLARGQADLLKSFLYRNALINIFSNLLLIPFFGVVGASVASIIGNFSYFLKSRSAYFIATR
jgi:O-antigen/teichoic acid export membrane protein